MLGQGTTLGQALQLAPCHTRSRPRGQGPSPTLAHWACAAAVTFVTHQVGVWGYLTAQVGGQSCFLAPVLSATFHLSKFCAFCRAPVSFP